MIGGPCTYIQNTCMVNLGRLCNGVVTALRIGRDGPWKLVVISGLFSKRKDGCDLIEYFEWKGAVTSPGIPDCFYCKNWGEMKAHFDMKTEFVSAIK
eukprot:scaffold1065_cov114-Skeletonema_dohrnii-CCMP3373.AAC.8